MSLLVLCSLALASLGDKDSNLDSQSQSLVSCHWTIPQRTDRPYSTARLRGLRDSSTRAGASYLAVGPLSSSEPVAGPTSHPSTATRILPPPYSPYPPNPRPPVPPQP